MIKRITTNIKSRTGQPYSVDLGKCTLLIGPNESGKSSIAEACQLALTGSASGLFLRDKPVKTAEKLTALVPDGADMVFSEAELGDESTARWELSVGSRAKRTGVKGVSLPVSELRTAFSGSSLTTYKFLYAKLASPEKGRITLERLDEAAKTKRDIQAKLRDLGNLLSQFSSAQEVDNSETYSNWEKLFRVLKFEFLKKSYQKHQSDEIKKMLLDLGTIQELKSLENSVEVSNKLISLIGSTAVYESARAARDEASFLRDLLIKQEKEEDEIIQGIKLDLYSEKDGLIWDYIDDVTKHLSDKQEFSISASGRFGLYQGENNNHFRSALSGSAEARVLAAMAAALPKNADVPGLIVVEDRMWDHQNLAKTMHALEQSPYQVLIMTTTKPRGRKRSGWKYIFTETDFEFQEKREEDPESEEPFEFAPDESTTDAEIDQVLGRLNG
tara:strand:+ start:19396 stop:20727 length:1332 start_codon:yes stop_codon:yes gene_type:complete